MSVDLIDALGLRERKKLETRRALVSVTLELFTELGLKTTTVRAETLTASASNEDQHGSPLWTQLGRGVIADTLLTPAPEPRRQRPRRELDSTSTGMPIGAPGRSANTVIRCCRSVRCAGASGIHRSREVAAAELGDYGRR